MTAHDFWRLYYKVRFQTRPLMRRYATRPPTETELRALYGDR